MSELTDRMRTCAAHLASCDEKAGVELVLMHIEAIRDATKLLSEAADTLEAAGIGMVTMDAQTAQALGLQPMEIIPPLKNVSDDVLKKALDDAITAHFQAPPPPAIDKPPSERRINTCPRCDSRAAKTVRRRENKLMIECPVCLHAWEYKAAGEWR